MIKTKIKIKILGKPYKTKFTHLKSVKFKYNMNFTANKCTFYKQV